MAPSLSIAVPFVGHTVVANGGNDDDDDHEDDAVAAAADNKEEDVDDDDDNVRHNLQQCKDAFTKIMWIGDGDG